MTSKSLQLQFGLFRQSNKETLKKPTNQKLAGEISSLDSNYKEVSSYNFLIASIWTMTSFPLHVCTNHRIIIWNHPSPEITSRCWREFPPSTWYSPKNQPQLPKKNGRNSYVFQVYLQYPTPKVFLRQYVPPENWNSKHLWFGRISIGCREPNLYMRTSCFFTISIHYISIIKQLDFQVPDSCFTWKSPFPLMKRNG